MDLRTIFFPAVMTVGNISLKSSLYCGGINVCITKTDMMMCHAKVTSIP